MFRKLKLAAGLALFAAIGFDSADAQVLDAGNTSTFAIDASGNVVQWGQDFVSNPKPTLTDAISVVGGSQHALALRSGGSLVAWGGSPIFSPDPGVVPPSLTSGTFTAIAAGADTSFALRADGSVAAWGRNEDLNGNVVTTANGLSNIAAISASGDQFAVLTRAGTVASYGFSSTGAGTGAPGLPGGDSTPSGINPNTIAGAVAISAGNNHALALLNNNTAAAWGNLPSDDATSIAGVTGAAAVAAGSDFSLVLRSNGTVFAAGPSNSYTGITDLSNVVYVTAGSFHSYAVQADGSIQGFGLSGNGQINSSITDTLNLPTTASWASGTSGDYLNSHRWAQGIPSTAKSDAIFASDGTYSVNFGNNAQARSLAVSGGGNVTFSQNANSFNAGSSISVSGTGTSLTVTGAGSQLTATALTNSATLAVSAGSTVNAPTISNSGLISVATGGQLATSGTIANSGSLQNSGAVSGNISGSGSVTNSGTITGNLTTTGSVVNNGTITGNVSTTGAGVLSGSGAVSGAGLTANGGILAPGNSVGVFGGANWEFGQAGTFHFEINNATGTAGGPSGWDLLALTGTLNITATPTSRFLIDLDSLDGALAGPAANFNSGNNYSWAFVTATSITGFAADLFAINSTGFANGTDGGWFSVSQSGNSLLVNFTSLTAIPEPSSLAILTVGGVGFAAYKRRRKSRLSVS